MALNLAKPAQKAKINAGLEIFKQGSDLAGIVMVHQGKIDLIYSPENENDQNGANNVHLWQVGDNSICGDSSFVLNQKAPFSAVSSQPSIISIFPVAARDYRKIIIAKPNLGMMIAKSLIKQLLESVSKLKQAGEVLKKMQRIQDNLGFALYKLDAMRFAGNAVATAPEQNNLSAHLEDIQKKVSMYISQGNSFPQTLDMDFLNQDLSSILQQKYFVAQDSDEQRILFYRRFFSMPGQYQQAFFDKNNISLLVFLCSDLAHLLMNKVDKFSQIHS